MPRRLSTRDARFFDPLERAADRVAEAASLLDELLHHFPERNDLSDAIADACRDARGATRELSRHLAGTFVTPIEREDLVRLAGDVDAVVRLIDRVAEQVVVVGMVRVPQPARRLAHLLAAAAAVVRDAMPELRRAGDPARAASEVDEIVQEGRDVARAGISELFATDASERELIAWKDLYDDLRDALQSAAATSESLMTTAIRNR